MPSSIPYFYYVENGSTCCVTVTLVLSQVSIALRCVWNSSMSPWLRYLGHYHSKCYCTLCTHELIHLFLHFTIASKLKQNPLKKNTFQKPTTNRVIGELSKTVFLQLGIRQGCPLAPYYSTSFWGSRSYKTRKWNDSIIIGRDKIISFLLFMLNISLFNSPQI